MSQIIEALVGKRCMVKTDAAMELVGKAELACQVLEADDEWIKLQYEDRKKVRKTKIIRIDSIESIEMLAED